MVWPSFMEFYNQLPPDRLTALIQGLHAPSAQDPDIAQAALAVSIYLLREYHEWLGEMLEPTP